MSFPPIELHNPWLLLLALPAVAVIVWAHRRRGRVPALLFPSVRRFKEMRPTWRQRAGASIPALQVLAALLLVTAAARPRTGDSRTIVREEGIAIQMVLDRSSSMGTKMRYEGRERARMDIVKRVFEDFVSGDGELPGRKTDLIGLTTFARYTQENVPLLAEHEPLLTAVRNLKTVAPVLDPYDRPVPADRVDALRRLPREELRGYRRNPLDGTAIGDGIRRAVLSLVTAEEDLERGEDEGGYEVKGKVLIVLTDGEDNASEMDPVEAGRLAAENDIRLYYILFQERNVVERDIFGRPVVRRERSIDELLEVPRKMAGSPERAFLATDGDALREIYEQIDRLERTDIGRIEYRNYEEKYHLFLVPGLAFAVLAMLLGETFLRRIP